METELGMDQLVDQTAARRPPRMLAWKIGQPDHHPAGRRNPARLVRLATVVDDDDGCLGRGWLRALIGEQDGQQPPAAAAAELDEGAVAERQIRHSQA